MRKFLFFIPFLFSISLFVNAQTIVETNTQLKNIVLEEFTGIYCGYCPEGHAIAEEISSLNPGRVVLVNIHTGGYAVPQNGTDPDFQTIFGEAIAAQSDLTGYPAGTVNRHLFSQWSQSSGTAMGRNHWANASDLILPEASPVNVGFVSSFDSITRVLTVNVEAYYTIGSPEPINYLNVAFLENHVFGYQSGGSANYDHKHILRHFITGQWGEEITTTSQGSFFSGTYTYTVPAEYVIENCDVAVYISETHQEIYTGCQAPADGGSNDGSSVLFIGTIVPTNYSVFVGSPTNTSTILVDVQSALSGTEDFIIKLSDNAPTDWNAVFTINGADYTDSVVVSLDAFVTVQIEIKVSPGATPAIGDYVLSMKSVSNQTAPETIGEVSVISDITDLVLHNTGNFGADGGQPSDFDADFAAGLDYAGNTNFASISYEKFISASDGNALTGVEHLYYNAAWVFPVLTDECVAIISDFVDNGGNLYISGQDLAWATWASDDYWTTNTREFFTNYLNAEYQDDGSSSNNSIYADTSDEVFGSLSSSDLINIYGLSSGNPMMYPDELVATDSGSVFLYYNDNINKGAAVRSTVGEAKIVYLGFDLPMIDDIDVRKEIIKLTHDWFHELADTSSNFVENQDLNTSVDIFPNPSDGNFTISVRTNKTSNSKIEIYNLVGNRVFTDYINNQQFYNKNLSLDIFPAGIYYLKLSSNENVTTKRIIITK